MVVMVRAVYVSIGMFACAIIAIVLCKSDHVRAQLCGCFYSHFKRGRTFVYHNKPLSRIDRRVQEVLEKCSVRLVH